MGKSMMDFASFNYTSVKASDVNLGECSDHPIVDAYGNVYFFLGQLEKSESEYKVRTVRNCDIGTSNLIRVLGGHLFCIENFGHRNSISLEVKVLADYRVILPDRGASKLYGVVKNQKNLGIENDLTRSIFGLTQEELDNFLLNFSTLFQSFSKFNHKPCTTSSNRCNNVCDLSRRWIPVGFPYISYNDNNYYYSHLSLAGFYAFVSLLCLDINRNRSYKTLIENGISKELLDLILEANSIWQPSEIFTY
jgi:hypothetical protein